MNLLIQIIKSIVIWILVMTILILLILLPRGREDMVPIGSSYTEMVENYKKDVTSLSWELYKNNIKNFFTSIIENKSLGTTEYLHSVEYEIWRYFSKSLIILIPSIIISFFLGISKGFYDFYTRQKKRNLFGRKITSFFLSIPDYFIIIIIQFTLMALVVYGFPHIDVYGSETLSNKLLAISFLSMYPTFYIARIVETYLGEESGKDYVRTALSKGTPFSMVVQKHMLANIWLKIMSHLTTLTLYILSNLFIVEFLTGYRGGAYRFYRAFNVNNYFFIGDNFDIQTNLVIGFMFIFTFIVMLSHIITNIATHRILLKEGAEK